MVNTQSYNIKVKQYQELNAIDSELPIIEQNIYAVAAIKGITYQEASKIKLYEFKRIIERIESLNIRMLEKIRMKSLISLNGTKYHIEHKPERLTSGQLLDVINIRSKNQGEPVRAMHLLLAAMSRPKGKEYGDDNLTLAERAELFKEVELKKVWNIFVFFWNLWNDYFRNSEDYLNQEMDKAIKKTMEILQEGGESSA